MPEPSDSLFTTPEMAGVFSGEAHVARLLAFEAGLARFGLKAAAHDDPHVRVVLPEDAIERALDPAEYLGSADALIDRALAAYRAIQEER